MNLDTITRATGKTLHRAWSFFRSILYRPFHLVIGASTLMIAASLLLVLLISGKSRKALADTRSTIEIALPEESQVLHYHQLTELANIPSTPETTPGTDDADPLSVDMEPSLGPASIAAASRTSLHALTAETALALRPGVLLTDDLATFAGGMAQYLAEHHFEATITSGVRSSDHQLEIIKEKIARYGMGSAFPKLAYASVMEASTWMPAWEWLKAHHVPVNPPAAVIKSDGSEVGASLHTKGLALDVVSSNLDALTRILAQYGNTQRPSGLLHMTSLTREGDCVHIALTR